MGKLCYNVFIKSILFNDDIEIGTEFIIPFKETDKDFIVIN